MHAHVHDRLRAMAAGLIATALLSALVPSAARALQLPEVPATRTADEIASNIDDGQAVRDGGPDEIGTSPAASLLTPDIEELTPDETLSLEIEDPVEEPPKTPEQIAIDTAMAQVGKPYRWGATGPNAFDCSGLTGFAWAAAGVSLPRTSGAQFAALQRVGPDQMQPGDLVFSGYRSIGHVGLYIGDGKMVHSPRSGRTVEVSPLHSNLIGAGRPHP